VGDYAPLNTDEANASTTPGTSLHQLQPLQYLYKIKLTAYHDDVAEEV
jgi:hypothetical protein